MILTRLLGVPHTLVLTILVIFAWCLPSASLAHDEPAVELVPRFEPCRFRVEARFDLEPLDDPGIPGARIVQSGVIRLSPSPEADGRAMRLTFESWRTELTRIDGESTQTAVFDTQDLEKPASGDFARLDSLWRTLAPALIELRFADDGAVESISGMDDLANAAQGAWPPGMQGLGIFAPASAPGWLSGLWQLDPGRAGTPRRVGDTWVSSTRVPLGESQTATVTTKHLMERIAEGVAEISADARISIETSGQSGTTLRATDQEWTVRSEWDIARGRARRRVEARACTWETSLLGGVVTERVKATSRVEFTALD